MQEALLAAAGALEESAAAIRNYGARVKELVEAAKAVLASLGEDPGAGRLRAAIALVETRTLREAEALVSGGSDRFCGLGAVVPFADQLRTAASQLPIHGTLRQMVIHAAEHLDPA